jgi:hypothetical protein
VLLREQARGKALRCGQGRAERQRRSQIQRQPGALAPRRRRSGRGHSRCRSRRGQAHPKRGPGHRYQRLQGWRDEAAAHHSRGRHAGPIVDHPRREERGRGRSSAEAGARCDTMRCVRLHRHGPSGGTAEDAVQRGRHDTRGRPGPRYARRRRGRAREVGSGRGNRGGGEAVPPGVIGAVPPGVIGVAMTEVDEPALNRVEERVHGPSGRPIRGRGADPGRQGLRKPALPTARPLRKGERTGQRRCPPIHAHPVERDHVGCGSRPARHAGRFLDATLRERRGCSRRGGYLPSKREPTTRQGHDDLSGDSPAVHEPHLGRELWSTDRLSGFSLRRGERSSEETATGRPIRHPDPHLRVEFRRQGVLEEVDGHQFVHDHLAVAEPGALVGDLPEVGPGRREQRPGQRCHRLQPPGRGRRGEKTAGGEAFRPGAAAVPELFPVGHPQPMEISRKKALREGPQRAKLLGFLRGGHRAGLQELAYLVVDFHGFFFSGPRMYSVSIRTLS